MFGLRTRDCHDCTGKRLAAKRTYSGEMSEDIPESNACCKDAEPVTIKRGLKQDPLNTGGWLSGALHGKKATRIAQRYRLIFLPDERERRYT
jgi:hypothetical protein